MLGSGAGVLGFTPQLSSTSCGPGGGRFLHLFFLTCKVRDLATMPEGLTLALLV